VSSLPSDHVSADASLELGFRFAALQVGYWLGWAFLSGRAQTRLRVDDVGEGLARAGGGTRAEVVFTTVRR
jgi:hypothetical protein